MPGGGAQRGTRSSWEARHPAAAGRRRAGASLVQAGVLIRGHLDRPQIGQISVFVGVVVAQQRLGRKPAQLYRDILSHLRCRRKYIGKPATGKHSIALAAGGPFAGPGEGRREGPPANREAGIACRAWTIPAARDSESGMPALRSARGGDSNRLAKGQGGGRGGYLREGSGHSGRSAREGESAIAASLAYWVAANPAGKGRAGRNGNGRNQLAGFSLAGTLAHRPPDNPPLQWRPGSQ